jgi:RNA polymerase sigma-70 factor (ECF subfamily)
MKQAELINIINQCRLGNTEPFRKIVEVYQPMVFRVAFRLLCDEEEAKDVVQETFLRTWENLYRYKFEYKFSTWIYTIATRLCLDVLKKPHHKIMPKEANEQLYKLSSSDDVERKFENEELVQIIHALTSGLSPKQKSVFVLHYFEEQDTAEIEKITGLSPQKIKSNLYVAKQNILSKLKSINYDGGRKTV